MALLIALLWISGAYMIVSVLDRKNLNEGSFDYCAIIFFVGALTMAISLVKLTVALMSPLQWCLILKTVAGVFVFDIAVVISAFLVWFWFIAVSSLKHIVFMARPND